MTINICAVLYYLLQGLVKAGVEGYINKPCITNRSDCPNQVSVTT